MHGLFRRRFEPDLSYSGGSSRLVWRVPDARHSSLRLAARGLAPGEFWLPKLLETRPDASRSAAHPELPSLTHDWRSGVLAGAPAMPRVAASRRKKRNFLMTLETLSPARLAIPSPQPSCAATFLQTLVDSGIDTAFGIPGGTASPIFDALRNVRGLRYVATRHEAGAGFAALGHARATDRPALVLTTSGPGVTNVITAIASAHYEDVPMIVISGEVPHRAHGRGALQDGTQHGWRAAEVMRPVTRWTGTVTSASTAATVARAAYEAATHPRHPGPVIVSLPLDVGGEETAPTHIHSAKLDQCWTVDESAVHLIARELLEAKRPLLILGAGARRATAETIALAERLALPVVVTGHGKGAFPESHPRYLGIIGIGQHPSVDEYLAVRPDVTLIVGTGLDDLATNGWKLPLIGSRASFQVDRQLHALGRSMCSSDLVVGDAATVLSRVVQSLPSDVALPRSRAPRLARLKPENAFSDVVPLKPARVLSALGMAFPGATWCSDIGEHLAYALHYVEVDAPDQFHNFLGFGSMGSGVGAAIGMQLAWPERQVVCVCGDGGFSMMLGELITCVEQRIGVIFAVMNDGMWNMVEHGFRTVYGATPGGFVHTLADFDALATAVGALGVRVTTAADLEPERLRSLAGAGLPVVLDVRIDATEALSPGTRAASISHFCASAS